MAKHPNLFQIEEKLKKQKDFVLTRSDYIKMTGTDIPQNKYYTENQSAVAKRAYENGFVIEVIPEKLIFKKIS